MIKSMKRFLLSLTVVAISLSAIAADYGYMTFVSGSNTTTLSVEGMRMSLTSSTLTVTNTENGTQTFALASLTSMFFSDSEGVFSSIEESEVTPAATKKLLRDQIYIASPDGWVDVMGRKVDAEASSHNSKVAGARKAIAAATPVLHIITGATHWAFSASYLGTVMFSGGTTLTAKGKTFTLTDIDSDIYIDYNAVADNTVSTTYSGTSASVVVAGNVAQFISPTVSGASVSIVQNELVSETTCDEITYNLTGSSSAGGYYLSGSYKATVAMTDLSLTSVEGAAVHIDNGKRINLVIEGNNTLMDYASGTQKACLHIKGHPEVSGSGTLTVTGNLKHAIKSNEYLQLKKTFTGSIIVPDAVGDALHIGQYFEMRNGTITIQDAGDEGIQVEANLEGEEYDGQAFIRGGTININLSATAGKGIKSDSAMTITDELGYNTTLNITTTGGGMWDTEDLETSAAACLKSNGVMTIAGGTLTLTATGGGGKGISSDDELLISGGTITVTTSGQACVYSGSSINNSYTSSLDRVSTAYKSSPKGIKSDTKIHISGGTINVTTSGNGGEGIESKNVMTIADGTITVKAYDDAINASTSSTNTSWVGHLYITGGNITAMSTNNDAIDSNGNMYLQGGTVMALGASGAECGFDANDEGGYAIYITGGTHLGVGGNAGTPSSSASIQCYVTGSGSVSANSTISLKTGSTVLASFTIPSNYTASSGGGFHAPARLGPGGPGGGGSMGGSSTIFVSCPGLTKNSSYTLTNGSSSGTVTAQQYSSGGWH